MPSAPPIPTLPGMYESPVVATAEIVRLRKPGIFDARLPNGKVTCAHLSKALAQEKQGPTEGDTVRVELTPFDFDTARIVAVLGGKEA